MLAVDSADRRFVLTLNCREDKPGAKYPTVTVTACQKSNNDISSDD